jgi:hypothetical protein
LYTFPGRNINQLHQTDGKVQESLTIGVYVAYNKLIQKKMITLYLTMHVNVNVALNTIDG